MRTLATIREVDKLLPIANADRIEICMMKNLGWQVVVKKGELNIGDKVVFFEIDSALPIEERYEFLRASSYKSFKSTNNTFECFRLKTIKLKGVISQGLVLPITSFPEIKEYKVGDDVTEILHVQHYDEVNERMRYAVRTGGRIMTGNFKSSFISFCPKSDQTRIQNLMDYFDKYKDVEFTAEAKYDGSSCTVYMVDKQYDKDQFGVCSRNYNLKIPNKWNDFKNSFSFDCYPNNFIKRFFKRIRIAYNVLISDKENSKSDYINIVNKIGIEANLREYFKKTHRSICIQGEMVGPGINGNRDKYTEHHLFIFDVYDVDNKTFLDAKERHNIINELNNLCEGKRKFEEVDTIKDNWKVFQDLKTLDDMLKFVDRKTLRGNPLEGVVFKSINHSPYFSFKCINNKYLLAEKD